MDMRTGEIASLEEMKRRGVPARFLRPVVGMSSSYHQLDSGQVVRPVIFGNLSRPVQDLLARTGHATISRNSRCPCGSRRRFKRCCMMKG